MGQSWSSHLVHVLFHVYVFICTFYKNSVSFIGFCNVQLFFLGYFQSPLVILRYGMSTLKKAIVTGQVNDKTALFYNGNGTLQKELQIYEKDKLRKLCNV